MKSTYRRAAIVLLLIALSCGLGQWLWSAPATPIVAQWQLEKIENDDILRAIGVYSWKIQIPNKYREGKKKIVLKCTNGEKLFANLEAVEGKTYCQATVVIRLDPILPGEQRKILVVLNSNKSLTLDGNPEFTQTGFFGQFQTVEPPYTLLVRGDANNPEQIKYTLELE
jgi:hypothetical protein